MKDIDKYRTYSRSKPEAPGKPKAKKKVAKKKATKKATKK